MTCKEGVQNNNCMKELVHQDVKEVETNKLPGTGVILVDLNNIIIRFYKPMGGWDIIGFA